MTDGTVAGAIKWVGGILAALIVASIAGGVVMYAEVAGLRVTAQSLANSIMTLSRQLERQDDRILKLERQRVFRQYVPEQGDGR